MLEATEKEARAEHPLNEAPPRTPLKFAGTAMVVSWLQKANAANETLINSPGIEKIPVFPPGHLIRVVFALLNRTPFVLLNLGLAPSTLIAIRA